MPNKDYASVSASLGVQNEIIPQKRDETGSLVNIFYNGSPYHLETKQSLLLDWGRKRTGWIKLAGKGRVRYALASDLRIFDLFDSSPAENSLFKGDCYPSFVSAKARGQLELSEEPRLLQLSSNAFRYLRLTNEGSSTAVLKIVTLKPSEFPARPIGSFKCSDELINAGWQMGIDTVHLCTQPGEESQIPVFGPFGNGYVQWDGCRRDREIWGGDLRAGALAWYYNFADQSPIANSLYVIMNAQHRCCSEDGLFPGSGSTHQSFYEWAFWEVVCLWEYIMHTGDEKLSRFAAHAVPLFLQWCKKKFSENPDGWVHFGTSWMYTIPLENQALPALQAAAALGLDAMEKLFSHLGLTKELDTAMALRKSIAERFNDSFWNSKLNAYVFTAPGKGQSARSDLCTNCWAILADIASPEKKKTVLESMKKLHWTEAGSINISPVLETYSPHNNTIWPYANAYEVSARFHAGDIEGALEVFKRYVGRIKSIGHDTMFEMVNIDGSLPIEKNGNTFSFCHSWAAQASWALQRYLLGVAPAKVGWREFSFAPVLSPLKWVSGSIATPHGTIDVELENKKGVLKGKVTHPGNITCLEAAAGPHDVDFLAK